MPSTDHLAQIVFQKTVRLLRGFAFFQLADIIQNVLAVTPIHLVVTPKVHVTTGDLITIVLIARHAATASALAAVPLGLARSAFRLLQKASRQIRRAFSIR